jgi:hypothetical protein
MILVNDSNAIMLFNSGASHSFIATSPVHKYNLPLSMLKNQMIVSSPGGDMLVKHVCPKFSILIGGGGRIDVILGMDWLSKYNGLIDCAKKAARLTTSNDNELEYVAENLVTDKVASNRIVLNQLNATSTIYIRTISEFLDVFQKSYQVCHQIVKLSLLLN